MMSSGVTTMSESYVGRCIQKQFGKDIYSGTITAWDAEDNLYHVRYDDGDSEDLTDGEMQLCLIANEEVSANRSEEPVDDGSDYMPAPKKSVENKTAAAEPAAAKDSLASVEGASRKRKASSSVGRPAKAAAKINLEKRS